jgi:phenylacetic acid degradation operon negative regulatory protein
MLGLRELDRGLYVRPDNLAGGVNEVRERLQKLGLEAAAAVFVAAGFDAEREAHARSLWDGAALNRTYRTTRRDLEQWLERAGTLAPEVAAREAYLLGNEAIHQLVFDPLLPAPLVDIDERRAFVAAVLKHDEAGRDCWRRLHLGAATDNDDVASTDSIQFYPHTAPTRP